MSDDDKLTSNMSCVPLCLWESTVFSIKYFEHIFSVFACALCNLVC